MSDPGLVTTEEQAEQSGVMLVSVPLARRAETVERVANLCAYRMGWTLNPRENKMNVGEPQRVIEVVPLHEPVPREPKPVEPEKEPVYEPEKEPVEP